jgi:hypothetical protein
MTPKTTNSEPPHADALVPEAGPELLEDGQEEVFSYTAVERGDVIDPLALDPTEVARAMGRRANRPPPSR